QPMTELAVGVGSDPGLIVNMRQISGEIGTARRQEDHPVRAQGIEAGADGPVMAAARGRHQRPAIDAKQECRQRKGPMPFQQWKNRIHAALCVATGFGYTNAPCTLATIPSSRIPSARPSWT